MSTASDGLLLYLKLDDSDLKDISGQDNHGQLNGVLDLIPDDTFGGSLMFDGKDNYVSVADNGSFQLQGDLTIQAWVFLSAENNNWVRIIGKGNQDRRNYGLWYHQPEKKWRFQQYSADLESRVVEQDAEELRLNTWYHLAAVRDQDSATLYVNGIPVAHEPGFGGDPFTSDDPLTIGYAGFFNAHRGLIAHARLYNRALSADEILQDLEAGKMALAAFRAGHPVDFALYNEDDHYLIYITSDPDERHQLYLELHNISARDILLADLGETATVEKHHFELRFRRGTLSPKTIAIAQDPQKKKTLLKESDLWDLHLAEESDRTSLYLLCKNPQEFFAANGQEQGGLFLTGMRRTLQLQHISAAAGGGARGTRVELIPHQLTYKGDSTLIIGGHVQHLYIANHSGQKHIPLHVGFVGSNRILNDRETTSGLIVQFMNIARPSQEHLESAVITLQQKQTVKGKKIPASKLIISFDVAENLEDKPWALGTRNDLTDLKISVSNHLIPAENNSGAEITDGAHDSSWQREDPAHDQGVTKEWTLTRLQDKQLKRNECFFIYLSNIRSSLPSGSTNLTIHYKNIPGYWDGQFVLPIEKTPLLFHDVVDADDVVKSKVGIGTTRPEAQLEIKGPVSDDKHALIKVTSSTNKSLLYAQDDGYVSLGDKALFINQDGQVHTNNDLTVKGKMVVSGAGDTNVDLTVDGRMQSKNENGGLWVGEAKTSGKFVGGDGDGNIGFWNNGSWRLKVNKKGTISTSESLTVNGDFLVARSKKVTGIPVISFEHKHVETAIRGEVMKVSDHVNFAYPVQKAVAIVRGWSLTYKSDSDYHIYQAAVYAHHRESSIGTTRVDFDVTFQLFDKSGHYGTGAAEVVIIAVLDQAL